MTAAEHIRAAEKLLSQASFCVSDDDLTPVLPGDRLGAGAPIRTRDERYTHSQLIARAAVHARLALALSSQPHAIEVQPIDLRLIPNEETSE